MPRRIVLILLLATGVVPMQEFGAQPGNFRNTPLILGNGVGDRLTCKGDPPGDRPGRIPGGR